MCVCVCVKVLDRWAMLSPAGRKLLQRSLPVLGKFLLQPRSRNKKRWQKCSCLFKCAAIASSPGPATVTPQKSNARGWGALINGLSGGREKKVRRVSSSKKDHSCDDELFLKNWTLTSYSPSPLLDFIKQHPAIMPMSLCIYCYCSTRQEHQHWTILQNCKLCSMTTFF